MAKNLVNKVGEVGQDNLFAHPFPRALTKGVKIASGENELKRGTVLYTDDGAEYKQLDDANKEKASVILADTVDATDGAVAVVYISGNFNRNALIFKEDISGGIGHEIEDALRHYNIILSDMQE